LDNEIIENHKNYLERKKLYSQFGYNLEEEREFILNQAKPISGKILEAGTGKGHFTVALAMHGYSFTSFDISEEELHFAKLNLGYYGFDKNVDLRIENAEQTNFADETFDMIFSINTLHHFHNPYKVIDELMRLLTKDGKISLSDFTDDGFAVIDKIHALENKTHDRGNVFQADVKTYLNAQGFKIKQASTAHQWVLVAGKELN
jgi:2-polyprenyl-3-methyl-5-hydroxy-6-metoxy-1,4-benzoquinol methylase